MATSSDVLCGFCEDQDITKHADQWCPECEEGLCFDCLNYHKSSRATKYHEIISVENFKKLPTSISSIVHHCKVHDKKYQNYCPHHESLCCPVCIAIEHKACNNLMVIDDIIKNAKSSSLLDTIEESIDILKKNLQLLIEEKDSNLNENVKVKNDFLEHLRKVREQINAHFDNLEQQIKQEMLAAEKQIKDQTDTLPIKELKEKLRAAEELQNNVVAVKEYASDLQTCLGSMSLKSRVEEEEQYLKSLEENGKLNQIVLKCTLDEQILADIVSMKTFGSVSTNAILSTVDLFMQGKRQAQSTLRPVPRISKSFDEINISLKCKFEIPASKAWNSITGCVFRPNEIMVINRENSRLLIFDDNKKFKKSINLPSIRPTDVTSVDDKTICVSYCDGKRLDLINTDSFETIQTIKTTGYCCGITSEHGTLFWYEESNGIKMKKQLNDDISTLVKADDDCYWCYVSVHDGRLYQTNQQKKTVSCFTCDNQEIWQFKDESILTCPIGIAVDEDSNVYVADYNEGIFVLSADGQNCRQLLRTNDRICFPVALCYDRIHDRLLVSNQAGPVFLYSIS